MKSLVACPSDSVIQPAALVSEEEKQVKKPSIAAGRLPAGQSATPMPIPSRSFDERTNPDSPLSKSVSPRGYPPKKVVKRVRSISTPPAGIYHFIPPAPQQSDQPIFKENND